MTIAQFVRGIGGGIFVILLIAGRARAAESCEPLAGQIVTVEGRVEIQRAKDETWLRAELEDPVCQSDTIRVGERSRATVALINDAVLRIDENTTLRLLSVAEEEEEPSLLGLFSGHFNPLAANRDGSRSIRLISTPRSKARSS